MKKSFILILILAVTTVVGAAQEKRCEVFGVVTDSFGNPIENLTIFIPFTSVGTTTNSKGEYKLEKVPAGEIELVFRHVSYQAHTEALALSQGSRTELNISVKSQVVELSEVVKRADPANWKFGYGKFKEYLLGDPIGRFCEVKNPTDLFFYYDGERLTCHATKPLEIENKYLGYTMVYFLDYFWYNQDKKGSSGRTNQVSYAFSGSAFYIDMIEDGNRKNRTWVRNRELEFRGTIKHFLMSLYSDSTKEEGYEIKQAWLGLKEFQESLNISPAVAYARSMELEKRFYWDDKTNKSTNILYLPGSQNEYKPEILMAGDSTSIKSIVLKDRILVFHYWDDKRRPEEIRVAYLSVIPEELGPEPKLVFTERGDYQLIGGELIWHYLDSQTKLAIALPVDYVGRLGVVSYDL
jgi:hypothetical protein